MIIFRLKHDVRRQVDIVEIVDGRNGKVLGTIWPSDNGSTRIRIASNSIVDVERHRAGIAQVPVVIVTFDPTPLSIESRSEIAGVDNE
jgi:hypothetical protein